MRVALSVPAFLPYSFGGGEVYVQRLARALRERGHEVSVLTATPEALVRGGAACGEYVYEGTSVVLFRPEPASWRERHALHGQKTTSAIEQLITRLRPDVVHINGWKPATAEACRRLGVPHVTTAHHAGIVCPAGTLVTPERQVCERPMSDRFCVPCATRLRRPGCAGRVLATIPARAYRRLGERLNDSPRLGYWQRGLIYPWLVEQAIRSKRTVLDDPALIIAPSIYIRDALVRNGRKRETITVIPHAVEPLQRTRLEAFSGRSVRFGYLGRIEPLKGIGILLSALERLRGSPPCELHVYGAPRNSRDEVYFAQRMRRYRGGAKVTLHGRIDPADLAGAYRSIDALIVPSLIPEAFGLVVLEAFSAGRPVVVFPSGALPELVRNEIDGLVVPRADSSSLAEALQRILDEPERLLAWADHTPAVDGMGAHADAIVRAYARALEANPRGDSSGRELTPS